MFRSLILALGLATLPASAGFGPKPFDDSKEVGKEVVEPPAPSVQDDLTKISLGHEQDIRHLHNIIRYQETKLDELFARVDALEAMMAAQDKK